MPDQGLIGHRFHGSQLLDGHDLERVYLESDILKFPSAFS